MNFDKIVDWFFGVVFIVMVFFAGMIAQSARAHELPKAECAIAASDAKQVAIERDSGRVTYKMQIEQLADLLPKCPILRPTTCIYRDDEDTFRAQTTVGWIYGNPNTAHLSPQAIEFQVKMTCELDAAKREADEDLMETLRHAHGVIGE